MSSMSIKTDRALNAAQKALQHSQTVTEITDHSIQLAREAIQRVEASIVSLDPSTSTGWDAETRAKLARAKITLNKIQAVYGRLQNDFVIFRERFALDKKIYVGLGKNQPDVEYAPLLERFQSFPQKHRKLTQSSSNVSKWCKDTLGFCHDLQERLQQDG